MPSLGADMTEGTMLEWLVTAGDTVHRGDLVAVVKTDKADIEVEVFDDGTIGELLVPVGATVEVGTPLATIVEPGTPPAAPPPAGPEPAPVPPPPPPTRVTPVRPRPPVPASPSTSTSTSRVAASPYARRRAAELGVDLTAVTPAQPGHPVTAADVERARVAVPRAAEPADQASAMRRAIGKLMARSKREIPHYYLQDEIPLGHALHWLSLRNEGVDVEHRVLPAAMFCKAVALAARRAPALNGFWVDDEYQPSDHVHLGVAIALRGGGLVAPAIHDADDLPLDEMMTSLRDLTMRARNGRLRGSEMSDPTITVTILGDQGVRTVFGVIYPPQVALVGFGRIVERVCDIDGGVGLRPAVDVTLAGDHRATDGHTGGRFVADIARRLQHSEEL
jgi:pyruvate dehydrogenase E2 component (dihydrolipoamide acetyltransferase)